jgi:hypothetical protein
MINEADVKAFFAKIEAEAEVIENDVEKEAVKAVALAGQFLRSTAAALAKDPVLLAALQDGFGVAKAAVLSAVEGGGTAGLVVAAETAAKDLLKSLGHTAAHELVPIVTAELHASVAPLVVAVPTVVNP